MTKDGYAQVLVSNVIYDRLKSVAKDNGLSLGRTIARLLENQQSIDTVSIPQNPVNSSYNNDKAQVEPRQIYEVAASPDAQPSWARGLVRTRTLRMLVARKPAEPEIRGSNPRGPAKTRLFEITANRKKRVVSA